MIAYALSAAKESGLFDKIHISTESEDIKSTVENLGYKIDFLRPRELADDLTGLLPVLRWVLAEYKKKNLVFEDVCLIMPTAPLLEPEDLIEGFDLYQKSDKKHPLIVVAPFPVPIEWAFYRDKKGLISPVTPDALNIRSQDIKKTYYETGPFCIFHSKHLDRDNIWKEEKFISLLMPRDRAVDIDDEEDLQLAKTFYRGRLKQK